VAALRARRVTDPGPLEVVVETAEGRDLLRHLIDQRVRAELSRAPGTIAGARLERDKRLFAEERAA
jgi:hypothetical protein